jgi:rare lipoprotein A
MFKVRAKMITVGLLGTAALLPLDVAKADQVGHASWYALHSRTASGERMNPEELTAAHRSLPFGTKVLVQNLSNGRSVVVRINDRGPFIGGRIIDLSKAAAQSIGMIDAGTAKVRVITEGGNALAALGEAASKVKNGASLAAVANVDLTPSETPPKAKAVAEKQAAKKTRVASLNYVVPKARVAHARAKSKTVAWKASSKTRYAAKSRHQHMITLAERPSHAEKRVAKLEAKAAAKKLAAKSFARGRNAKMVTWRGRNAKMATWRGRNAKMAARSPYASSTKRRAS